MSARSKNKVRTSGRPICVACNRPFDPRSEGATPTMGPTCAKRQGGSHSTTRSRKSELTDGQLNLLAGESAREQTTFVEKREAASSKTHAAVYSRLPRFLADAFIEASHAFDDLYREFSEVKAPVHGEVAHLISESVKADLHEEHCLRDAILDWLDPELDLRLLVDLNLSRLYYVRVLNDIPTLLEIDTRRSQASRVSVQRICRYRELMDRYRKAESMAQLSLLEL